MSAENIRIDRFTPLENPGTYGKGKPKARSFLTGFTLIEVLLASAIAAFALISAYSALRLGLMSYRRMEVRSEAYHTLRASLNRISKDLMNSFIFNAADDKEIYFSGKNQEMNFATLIKANDEEGLLYTETARAYYQYKNKILSMAYVKNKDLLAALQAEPEYEPLMDNISEFSLSYASLNTSGTEKIAWADAFENSAKLPAAVRIKLTREIEGLRPISLTKSISLRRGSAENTQP